MFDTNGTPVSPDEMQAGAFVCSWTFGGPDAAWVRTSGELDMAGAPKLDEVLAAAQAHGRLVVVDLRELKFMDSTGLQTLLVADERARAAHGRLVLIRGPHNFDRLFAITGVEGRIEVLDLDAVEPPPPASLHTPARHSRH